MAAVSRKRYHTGLVILHQNNALPTDIRKQIPYSTLHNWKKKDKSIIVGVDDPRIAPANIETIQELITQHHLMPVVRTLLHVNRVLLRTLHKTKKYKKLLAQEKDTIIRITERFEKLLQQGLAPKTNRKRILKWFGVSLQQFHYWKREVKQCPSSLLDLCRVKHPHQLTTHETSVIRKYVNNPQFEAWSLVSIYLQILRDGAAFFALSTFYQYCRKMGVSKKFRTFKTQKQGIRASKPGEIIHADITEFKGLVDHRKVHIYHFSDNFSRFRFRAQPDFNRLPEITLRNLEAIIADYPHLFEDRATLLVDDGVENKGALSDFADKNKELVILLIALKDIVFSNSMIEAHNKTLKNNHLKDRIFSTIDDLADFLENDYLQKINDIPLLVLGGYTPREVLNGAIPEKGRFRPQIHDARKARIAENQAFNCQSCSSDSDNH